MKLILKIVIGLALVFAVAASVAAYIAHGLLLRNAREEVLENARIMMEAALAVRSYTNTQIKPLLETQLKYQFLPQSVPAFSASEYFNNLRKTYPDYSYKEATLNPTNPRNRAVEWEADIVNRFRNTPTLGELVGERDTQYGRSLYMARPIQVKSAACLVCHSSVAIAPKTMIDLYGTANGFGWQINDIVGAQVVSVPMEVPVKRAHDTFQAFLLLIAGLFAFLFVVLYALLHFLVVRPIRRLAAIADRVSMGDLDAPEFDVTGKDELLTLAQSFGRMRKSLVHAMKMLDG